MKEARYYSIAKVFKVEGIETVSRNCIFFLSNVVGPSLHLVCCFKHLKIVY